MKAFEETALFTIPTTPDISVNLEFVLFWIQKYILSSNKEFLWLQLNSHKIVLYYFLHVLTCPTACSSKQPKD